MRAVNIKEAKARLNELIDAATEGEQVVLMRGSKHVAAIVPISADDLELLTTLTDAQAERLWRALAEERAQGKTVTVADAEAAVRHLGEVPPVVAAAEPGPSYGAGRTRKKSGAGRAKKKDQ